MSKKVIESVIIEQKKHTSFELIENDNGDLGIRTIVALFTLEKEFRTTVAKAICPEYQKVIDQNAKLVEALREFNTYLTNRFSMLRQNAGKSTNDKSKAQFQLLNEISDKFRSLQNTKKIEG